MTPPGGGRPAARPAAVAAPALAPLGLHDDGRGHQPQACPSDSSATFPAVISTTLSLVVDRQTGSGHGKVVVGFDGSGGAAPARSPSASS